MHAIPPYNEKELLQQIAEGDEHAFRVIYDLYRPSIYSYTLRLTETEQLADDVVQDVFMKVWLYRSRLPAVENFRAWVKTIARNTVLDAFKSQARQKTGKSELIDFVPLTAENADVWLLDKENAEWLHDALNQLTPSQKRVYLMSRQQGMKLPEIAEELDISINTAKKHLVNSLQGLRTYLEKHNTILAIITAETLAHYI